LRLLEDLLVEVDFVETPKPGLASKRIATFHPLCPHVFSSFFSETRTRFKEDCDEASPAAPSTIPPLRNQDSLQRGLRHGPQVIGEQAFAGFDSPKPGLASKRIATFMSPI